MIARFLVLAVLYLMLTAACSDESTGTWRTLAPMPTPRTEVAVAALGTEIFVIGGFDADGSPSDKVEIYETKTDTWRDGAPLYEPRHHAAVVRYDNRVWVIGGFAGSGFDQPRDTVWVMTSDGRRGKKQPLVEARGGLAAVPDRMIVFGGVAVGPTGQAVSLSSVEAYDLGTDSWFTTSPAPSVPRDHHAVATAMLGCDDVCHDHIYVIGGRTDLDPARNLNANEDCALDACRLAAPLPTARSGIAAVSFPDGSRLGARIYVFGGESPEGTFDENEMYDPEKDEWRTMAPMPTARHGLGAAVVGDTIYVIGGGPEPGLSVSGANEAYTPPQP